MKKLLLAFLLILSLQAIAQDSTRIKMGGTYTTTEGKKHDVYLDQTRSKLFYEVKRNKVRRVYFRKVTI